MAPFVAFYFFQCQRLVPFPGLLLVLTSIPEDGAVVLQLWPLDQQIGVISWELIVSANSQPGPRPTELESLGRVPHLCLSSPPGDSDASSSLKISEKGGSSLLERELMRFSRRAGDEVPGDEGVEPWQSGGRAPISEP